MEVTLQYIEGCPNWRTTDAHLRSLIADGLIEDIRYELIDSHETAVERGFTGSPTVLIDGLDPFSDEDAPCGLACRIYRSATAVAGSPTMEQLRSVIDTRAGRGD